VIVNFERAKKAFEALRHDRQTQAEYLSQAAVAWATGSIKPNELTQACAQVSTAVTQGAK
jgi:hypothetical protein